MKKSIFTVLAITALSSIASIASAQYYCPDPSTIVCSSTDVNHPCTPTITNSAGTWKFTGWQGISTNGYKGAFNFLQTTGGDEGYYRAPDCGYKNQKSGMNVFYTQVSGTQIVLDPAHSTGKFTPVWNGSDGSYAHAQLCESSNYKGCAYK